jgi:hypothetical protein
MSVTDSTSLPSPGSPPPPPAENNLLRMAAFGSLALVTLALLAFLAWSQMTVIVLKVAEISLGAFLGYWLDRHLFPYARPHTLTADTTASVWSEFDRLGYVYAASMLRRAFIVGMFMLSMALAL